MSMLSYARFGVIVLGVAVACSDQRGDPAGVTRVNDPLQASRDAEIPPRASDFGGHWVRMDDAELWRHVAHDSLVIVGIKEPGRQRGIWRGEVLITANRTAEFRSSIHGINGLSVARVDSLRPAVLVKVTNKTALENLRRQPFVDYIEPATMPVALASPGCDWDGWSGSFGTTFAGDLLPPHFSNASVQIDRAWNRATGEGTVIGITDTGVGDTQHHLTTRFDEGYSSGRTHSIFGGFNGCSHGPRMAGVAAAPMNGESTVGVAWKASVVSARIGDSVVEMNGFDAADGIDIAASYGPGSRRIVVMAWRGHPSAFVGYNHLSDVIRWWYSLERLFIGASGSADWPGSDVVFPASMPEVIAVSAVHTDFSKVHKGSFTPGVRYGPKVELAFFVKQPAPGEFTTSLSKLDVSSGATAIMSGIAALVWSRYPTASRDWVRQRLQWAAHGYPNRNDTFGYGVPNVFKATGGMYASQAYGCTGPSGMICEWPLQVTGCITQDLYSSPLGGDGPFSYSWSNGSSSSSTTIPLCSVLGVEQEYSIANTITDLSDGSMMYKLLIFRVRDPAHCGGEWPC